MSKINLFRKILNFIKNYWSMIFILLFVILFSIVYQRSSKFEEKLDAQNYITNLVEDSIETNILLKRRRLSPLLKSEKVHEWWYQVKTSENKDEDVSSNIEGFIKKIFSKIEHVEKIIISNLSSEHKVEVALDKNINKFDDADLADIVDLKSSWILDEYGSYKIKYRKTNTGDLKLLVCSQIQKEEYKGDYVVMQIDMEALITDKILALKERLVIVDDQGEVFFIEDNNDMKVIEELKELYGSDVFLQTSHELRNKVSLGLSDITKVDGNIITTIQIRENINLILLREYDDFSFDELKASAILVLFVLIIITAASLGIMINSSNRTSLWIKNEKQFLNEIIDIDKISITQLKSELRFYQEFITDSKQPLIMVDTETNRVFMVNRSATKFFNYSEDEMLGMYLSDLSTTECKYDSNVDSLPIECIKSDSSKENVRIRIQEISFNDTDMLILMFLAKNLIPIGMNHDLRTEIFHEIRSPLQGAFGAIEMIEKATNHYGEYTNIIKRSIANVLEITNNVLAKEKISNQMEEVNATEFNLLELVREVNASTVFQDKNYNQITSKVELNENDTLVTVSDYMIKTDIMKLRHILINLLSNASKYTKNGLVTLNIEILRKTRHEELIFRVSDTGIGFSKEEQNRMYDKFATFAVTEKQMSSGIGLSIAKKFVELLNSKLEVHSTKNVGSVFQFTLETEPCASEITKFEDNKSILIVDDDEISCEFLRHYFENTLKYRVKTITNEALIFEELNHFAYDCILLDQNLNDFKGLDIVRLIRKSINKRIANVPIILMSAVESKNMINNTSDLKLFDIILKPFDSGEIELVLNNLFKGTSLDNDISIRKNTDQSIVDGEALFEIIEMVGAKTFNDLLLKFIQTSRSDIRKIEELITTDSLDNVYIIIHRLKGSMLYFAPVECKGIISKLEKLSYEENYSELVDYFIMFKESYDLFIYELELINDKLT